MKEHYEIKTYRFLGCVPVVFHFRFCSPWTGLSYYEFPDGPVGIYVKDREAVAKKLFPTWTGGLSDDFNRRTFREFFSFLASKIRNKRDERLVANSQTIWMGWNFIFCRMSENAVCFELMDTGESQRERKDFTFELLPRPKGK